MTLHCLSLARTLNINIYGNYSFLKHEQKADGTLSIQEVPGEEKTERASWWSAADLRYDGAVLRYCCAICNPLDRNCPMRTDHTIQPVTIYYSVFNIQ